MGDSKEFWTGAVLIIYGIGCCAVSALAPLGFLPGWSRGVAWFLSVFCILLGVTAVADSR